MPRIAFIVVSCVLLSAVGYSPATAATTAGIQGPTFGSKVVKAPFEATGEKPESKLFSTEDGRWWGALGFAQGVGQDGVYLAELTQAGGWQPRLLIPGSDPWAKADTLYDVGTGSLLVSLRDVKKLTSNPRVSTLNRFSYDGGGAWSVAADPITITTAAVETLTIAKDTAGLVWASWEQGRRIKAAFLKPGTSSFTIRRVSNTNVKADDISAVVAFDGKIGILWSDQIAARFQFAWRIDGKGLSRSNWHYETAYGGGVGGCPTTTSALCADDHVNLTVANGELFASVKTSLNDAAPNSANDPLVALLHRPLDGAWEATPVSPVKDDFTRPIVLTDPSDDVLAVFATELGGSTFWWQTSLSSPDFTGIAPTPWTVSDGLELSNPTSTKQNVSSASGIVVMTSTPGAPYQYWYNVASIPS